MKTIVTLTTCAILLAGTTGMATAGGMERTRQPIDLLFENGTYATVSLSHRSPSITGENDPENMSLSFTNITLGYKRDLTDRLSFAASIYQPAGADVDYSANGRDLFADIKFNAASVALKYQVTDGVSAFGGIKYVEAKAMTDLSALGPFLFSLFGPAGAAFAQAWTHDKQSKFGYFAGVAYEREDIKMRVSLTYNSKIDFALPTTLTNGGVFPVSVATTGGIPQSVTLDFRSGIAPDTLLFGALHWAEWGKQNVSVGPVPISSFQNTLDVSLGVARRLRDQWVVTAAVNNLAPNGGDKDGITGRFAPYDGYQGVSLGAQHTRGNMKIGFGVNYTKLNGAFTNFGQFSNNHVLSGGMSVGFSY